MKILKFGGSTLHQPEALRQVLKIIQQTKEPKAIVLSAFRGVTDCLIQFLKTIKSTSQKNSLISKFVQSLKDRHIQYITQTIGPKQTIRPTTIRGLQERFDKLERLLYGVSYLEEISPRSYDLIVSFGERLAIIVISELLEQVGIKNEPLEADKIGLITDGDFGRATAILPLSTKKLRKNLLPLIRKGITPLITGFFGCDKLGRTTIFGRGGSDYSASVVAYALEAECVELWKDTNGFMRASPEIIKGVDQIEQLSYEEAAELAYFGVEILHPRMIEPVMLKNIPIIIRNTFNPDHRGTIISSRAYKQKGVIKGIAYDRNISALKIHGAGVGYRPGVLHEITGRVAKSGINIKSVITSQTCINLLLSQEDLLPAYRLLEYPKIPTVEYLEKVSDIVLIAVVGEGLIKTKGLAAKVFSAVAEANVNVEMISAGASRVAYYFIIKEQYLQKTVQSIYDKIFRR